MEVPIHKNMTIQDLIQYIKDGADDHVKVVLENETNIKTPNNMTSLAKAAVEAGSKNIIVTLLEHGLNVNAALDIVVNSGKDDLIELMIEQGADINEGLYFAVKANKKDVIIYLLERGANINTKKRNGNTPLHTTLMQKCCDIELVEFLIKRGADTKVQTKNNKTALDLFQKFLNGKYDAATKEKYENIAILLGENQNSNVFECLMGLPDGLSGYSYQTKIMTMYAIMNTKKAISCAVHYELSTEVKILVPFDDIYLRIIQVGRTSCEFIQVKQTKKPEFNKISPSKFFTMLKQECKVKEHIKGNDSIVKIFLKFNEIQENLFVNNTSGVFIHCENTTFQDDSSPYLKRVDADTNDGFLCGIKHVQWVIDKKHLFIEIKYVLFNLIKTSSYFSIIDKEIKTIFNNDIKTLEKLRNENIDENIDYKTLSSMNTIAKVGLSAIEKYLLYLGNCKREIEKAIDTENVNKNLPDKFELLYTDDLALLINRAVTKINEVSKSFSIDMELFLYFSKFEDVVIREKIDNFVRNFRIYTDCPTSDKLDEIITKEISEEFKFDIPTLIYGHCLQYFSGWISNFKNEKGRVFTHKDGIKLFHDIRIQIFNASNKYFIEELERDHLCYTQNNEHVIRFLNKDNNYKILHVVTKYARLQTINILQTIKKVKEQPQNRLKNVVYTSLEHIMKSDVHVKNLFDIFTLQESSDLLILECLEDIETQKMFILSDYFNYITKFNAEKKLIIIAKNEPEILKNMKKEHFTQHTSYSETLAFKYLTIASQQSILQKTVNFRNNPNLLRTELKMEKFITPSAACEFIDECLLSTIVTNTEDIQIGDEKAFISSEYNAETFIPRYLLSINVSILIKLISNLVFVTGISKNELINKVSVNEQCIYIWEKNRVYDKGIVLMPHSHNVTSEEVFKRLTNNNKFCYWFEFRGDLLYVNRKDASKQYVSRIEQILTNDKLALENIEDKIVIVANDAGEGKSTMLTHLAHSMRIKSNNSWIIRVDLRNYADNNIPVSLNDITFCVNDTIKAVELVTRMVIQADSANTNNSLERKLLEAVLNGHGTMEVILLFDGFDEISPCFKEKTCKLLKALVKSHIKQLWVTTRVHLKEYLEKELGVQAHMLAGFTKLEQINFMCKLWKWQLNNYNNNNKLTEKEHLSVITNQLRILLKNIESSTNHPDHILKTLENYSLGSIQEYINNEKNFSNRARVLLGLWERSQKNYDFLKIPLHVEMIAKNFIQREWNHYIVRNSLQFGMYTEFVEGKLDIYDKKNTNRTGNSYSNDQADMVKRLFKKIHHEIAVTTLHSTLQVLPDLNISSDYPNFVEKLTKVGLVKCYGSRVKFVHRTFAEYFFSEYLVTHLDNPDVQTEFLDIILLNDDYYLVRTFFDEFLLQYQEQDNAGHVKTFENIFTQNVIQKIMKHNNSKENVLHVAVREGHLQIFLLILKNVPKSVFAKLITNNSREGCSMLELSIKSGHTAICTNIVDFIKELMIFSQYALFIQTPIKIITDTIKNHAIQILTTSLTGIYQGTLHKAAPININIENTKKYVFVDLVLKCDNIGRTVLHLAAENGQSCVCKSIINAAKACSVLEKLILCVDSNEKSVLYYAAQNCNREVIQVIVESLEESPNIFEELIKLTDKTGQNALHIAARFGRVDACYIILKSVESYEDTLKYLITQCNKYDKTALYYAIGFSNIEICKLILETAKKHNLLKELIMKSNINEKTILHHAANIRNEPLCTLIMETVKDHEDLIKYLITQEDGNSQTIDIPIHSRQDNICNVILDVIQNCKEDS